MLQRQHPPRRAQRQLERPEHGLGEGRHELAKVSARPKAGNGGSWPGTGTSPRAPGPGTPLKPRPVALEDDVHERLVGSVYRPGRNRRTGLRASRRSLAAALRSGRSRVYAVLVTGEDNLLIIIPAYNEQGRVGQVVRDVRSTLPGADVLVIDDGSADTRRPRRSRRAPSRCRCPSTRDTGPRCRPDTSSAFATDMRSSVRSTATDSTERSTSPRC